MPIVGFETNIYPATSARGLATIALTVIGAILCLVASQVQTPRNFALPLFLGVGMLFWAHTIRFNYQDFAVDSLGKQYQRYNSVLGMRLGDWCTLPPVTGVVMKYFSEMPVAGRRGWQVQNPLGYAIVMLSTAAASHQGIIVYKFDYRNKDQAILLTHQLATHFGVEARFFDAP